MKYKVLKGTELYQKLDVFMKKVDACKTAAREFVEKVGGVKYATSNQSSVREQIAAIEFEEQPEGWKVVGQKWQRLYFPKANMKAILKEIDELPTVKVDDQNAIIKFKPGSFSHPDGIGFSSSYGLGLGKGCFLITVTPGMNYKPVRDMIEIVESEFEKLKLKDKK